MKKHKALRNALFFSFLLLLLPSVFSLSGLCSLTESNKIGTNCTVLVSNTTCSTYTVLNSSGVVSNGSLSPFSGGVEQLSFTDVNVPGDYFVSFCDGSSTNLSVGGDEGMTWIFVLLPFLVSGLFLAFTFSLDREEHIVMRYAFGLFSLLLSIMGLYFAFIVNIDFIGSANIEDALTTFLWVLLLMFFALFAYIMFYLLFKWLKALREQKNEELKY